MIGRRLGDYKITERIGAGGMAIVYKANDLNLGGRTVAVKVLPENLASDRGFVALFTREARTAAKLSHPNVVTIHRVGEEDDIHYFAMSYIDGKSLSGIIEDRGKLPVDEIIHIVSEVCKALEYTHSEGVMHRDIKPANIMFDKLGNVIVTDFGIARAVGGTRLPQTRGVIGTAEYMSPEQAQGEEDIDYRTDIYSLGVVLYEMLTGRVPFKGTNPLSVAMKHTKEPPPPPRELDVSIPAWLESVVLKCLAKSPDKRYQSAKELRDTLQKLQAPPRTIVGRDGAEMMLIPAGEFEMGRNDGYEHEKPVHTIYPSAFYWQFEMGSNYVHNSEKPVHTVYLDAFYMDKYEVTNARYAKFLNEYGKNTDAAGHELIDLSHSGYLIEKSGSVYRTKKGYEFHPVVVVTWYGAAAYAQFYGKRLPTEAQWEKAARGGLEGKKYPWGDEIDETKANCNYSSRGLTIKDMLKYLKPVGSFPPNGYGLFDMAGNVWEWCAAECDANYYSKSPKNNPTGPDTPIRFVGSDFTSVKQERVQRGGSWFDGCSVRCTYRLDCVPTYWEVNVGFRCVFAED